MNKTGCVLVSWDLRHGPDKSIVIVGKKTPRKDVEVINAFQGKKAEEVLEALGSPHISKNEKSNK